MRVLFCSDAMIIDGVTSYVLHVGTALRRAGHEVAVLGRWGGVRGFQRRYREEGMTVITCPSATVGNAWFDARARAFRPDVIMTDSRRSFPLAVRLKGVTGSPVVTYFLDNLEKTDRPGRDVPSLVRGSNAWAVAEERIRQSLLQAARGQVPIFRLPRPLDTATVPSPLPPRSPFHILCFGRLSRYKTPGMFHILDNAARIEEKIPGFRLSILGGGGWRLWKFRWLAARVNRRLGRPCVRVLGTRDDPRPWLKTACVVCAGSTAAIEAALSLRPVIAMSGHYFGLVTPGNLDEAVDCYFAERSGHTYFSDPGAADGILPALFDAHDRYDGMLPDLQAIRSRMEPLFSSEKTVAAFEEIAGSLRLAR